MAIEGINYERGAMVTNTAISGKDPSQLDMNDFLNLLVAQMTNQDMMNPVNDTEFIAQMAQFSALQGVQTIQEYQLSAYAASYANKYVTIANTTPLGVMETISGKVESVIFYDGTPKVMVNGQSYDLYKIMEVSDTASTGSLADAGQYIGKLVTVAYKNEYDETETHTGVVTGVTIKDNVPCVIIDGKEYPVSQIQSMDSDKDEDEDEDGGDESNAAGASAKVSSAPTAYEKAAAKYDVELGQEVARRVSNGNRDANEYTDEEILAYATVTMSKKAGGKDIRTAEEIAKLIKESGIM